MSYERLVLRALATTSKSIGAPPLTQIHIFVVFLKISLRLTPTKLILIVFWKLAFGPLPVERVHLTLSCKGFYGGLN